MLQEDIKIQTDRKERATQFLLFLYDTSYRGI